MNNPFQMFTHPRFGNVRIGVLNNAPYFVGKDVAAALGYARPDNAIRKHVHPADKQSALITLPAPNQCMKCIKRKMLIINESGVYSLVLSANTPDAQEFKHWVTSEVLPSIFANGSYSLTESLDLPRIEPPPTEPQDTRDNVSSLLRAEKLIEVARLLEPSPQRQQILLLAANLLLDKNIF